MIAKGKFSAFLIFSFIISFQQIVRGQTEISGDSLRAIEQNILTQSETDITLLSKSRKAIYDALLRKDISQAKSIMQFIKVRFDTSKVIVLFPAEEMLINCWFKDYENIFNLIKESKDYNFFYYTDKLYPLRDLLFDDLQFLSQRDSMELIEAINFSDLPPYKKDFLQLLLKYLRFKLKDNEQFQAELNSASDEYLSLYKDSEFNPFIKQYIRYVIVVSDWGFGMELAAGYLSLPELFGSHVKDYGLLTLGLESTYKNLYGGLRVDIGAAHNIRKGFIYNGAWKDNLLLMHIGIAMVLGPRIPISTSLIVTPNAGISYSDYSPPEKEKDKEGNDVSVSFTSWVLGLSLDIPLSEDFSFTYLRANLSYRKAMTSIDIVKGGYIYFTLGIGLFSRPEVRDY